MRAFVLIVVAAIASVVLYAINPTIVLYRTPARAQPIALVEQRQRELADFAKRIRKIVVIKTVTRRVPAATAPTRRGDRGLEDQIFWGADWNAIAQCESSGRWNLNVGIFDGGLQFLPSTWVEFGGTEFAPFAYMATPVEQMVVASRVLAVQGPKAWPVCFRWASG